jgi:hypothetical protein
LTDRGEVVRKPHLVEFGHELRTSDEPADAQRRESNFRKGA